MQVNVIFYDADSGKIVGQARCEESTVEVLAAGRPHILGKVIRPTQRVVNGELVDQES